MNSSKIGGFAALASERYLNMETYRRTGAGVRTPVWFAADQGTGAFYIYTGADSGKVKRLRRTARVRIAACDMRGRVTGAWIDAQAEIVTGAEFKRGMALLNRKYWPWKQMLGLGNLLGGRHARAVIAIRPA